MLRLVCLAVGALATRLGSLGWVNEGVAAAAYVAFSPVPMVHIRSRRLKEAVSRRSRRRSHWPLCWARKRIQSRHSLKDEVASSSSISVSTMVKAMGSCSGLGDRRSSTMGAVEELLVGVGGVLELPGGVWEKGAAGGTLVLGVGLGPSWLSIHAV